MTGVVGVLWVVPWLWLYRRPEDHPYITDRERLVAAEREAGGNDDAHGERGSEWSRWRAVLGRADVWGLTLGRLLTDPVWYFFLFWLVDYLKKVRHLTQEQTQIVWVAFVAADVGTLAAAGSPDR